MHLLVPFASALSEEARQAMPALVLPNLERLLARFTATARDDADPDTLSPPHERALATAWGWRGADGMLPFAARAAAADGIDVTSRAWGLVTPAHWQVGRDHVSMADTAALALGADESLAFFEALRGLFESEGFDWVWGAPDRWYLAHPTLAQRPCASLDRVIGRNVDRWLGVAPRGDAAAGRIRRLQSEVQLLLYPHPLNEAREGRGELAVNSFWLSGCGEAQTDGTDAVEIDSILRDALFSGGVERWSSAWSALDAGPIARLLERGDTTPRPVALTLCGERGWQRFEHRSRSLWQRLRTATQRPDVPTVLAAL